MSGFRGWAVVVWIGLLMVGCTALSLPVTTGGNVPPPGLPNGVAAGDVTQASVVLWARAAHTGVVTFTLQGDHGAAPASTPITRTVSDPLLPVTVTVTGLTPATAYRYQVEAPNGDRADGVFRTPAEDGERRGLRFGASGDVRGDLAPYPALANAPDRELDFFVNLGDTAYADFASPQVPNPASTAEEFLRKQIEVNNSYLGVNTLAALRASTASFAILDDHEVRNNFAGGVPAGATRIFAEQSGLINEARLYRVGVAAFQAYQPIAIQTYGPEADARMVGRPQLYRYRTFGADAALFVVDMRSFRDAPLESMTNLAPPEAVAAFEAASFDPSRTLLGRTQMEALQRDLLDAQARGISWKFIFAPDPIQYLDMTAANDRWQGYAAERTELLRFIDEAGIDNVVFITADIHGMVVNDLTYSASAGGPQLPASAWEIAVGPVAAHPPFALAMFLVYLEWGLVTEADRTHYASLPIRHDGDDVPDDRDDYAKGLINAQMARYGFNPIGLDDAPHLEVELLEGDYMAGTVYGWTEFEIDAASQTLTVTTYGLPAYLADEMARGGEAMARRTPTVVSRFVVQPRGGG